MACSASSQAFLKPSLTLDKHRVASSVQKKEKAAEVKLPFSPTCVAVAPSDGLVAVGGCVTHTIEPAPSHTTHPRDPHIELGAMRTLVIQRSTSKS